MALRVTYTPAAIDAVLAVQAAGELGVEAAGKLLLDAAISLAPKDTGAMANSGTVDREGLTVAVSFGREDAAGRAGADTAAYTVIQHEDMTLNHPNGQAKFLETPMHSDAERLLAAIAAAVRVVL